MANFEGRTTSNGILLTKEQYDAVMKYMKGWEFTMEDIMFGEDTPNKDGLYEFGLWGYDWLNILPYEEKPDEWDDEVQGEFEPEPDYSCNDDVEGFLEGLKAFIPSDQELVINCIGATELRFPFAAMEIKINSKNIEWKHF